MLTFIGFLFSSVALGFGIKMLRRTLRFTKHGRFVVGTVTSAHVPFNLKGKVLTITFQTPDHRNVSFTETVGISSPDYYFEPGARIAVLYHPARPSDAVIYTRDALWTLPLAFIGIGLFFLFFTIYGINPGF